MFSASAVRSGAGIALQIPAFASGLTGHCRLLIEIRAQRNRQSAFITNFGGSDMRLLIRVSAVASLMLFFLLSSAAAEAPAFTAQTIEGKTVHLSDYKGKTLVLEWFNRGCPFVRHFYDSGEIQDLQRRYTAKGVVWLTVNSTNPKHPDYLDAEASRNLVQEWKIASSDFIIDGDGTLGHAYDVKATPTVFVIDPNGNIVYHGAIDNNPDTDDDKSKLKNYLVPALDAVLSDKAVELKQTEAYGCSVKY
jgi:peroxiredoxin